MSTLRTDTLQTTDSSYTVQLNQIASLATLAGTGAGQGAELVGRSAIYVDGIKNLQTLPTNKKLVADVGSYYEGGRGDNRLYIYDATRPKSQHNGGTIISPTVPWTGSQLTLTAFLAGTGESLPAGTGCWVLAASEYRITDFGAIATPGTNNFSAITKAVTVAAADKVKLRAPAGTFEFGTTLDFDYPTLNFSGNGHRNTVLKFTGTGSAVQADGTRPNNGIYSFSLDLSDFTIEGKSDTVDLLRIRINHPRVVRVNLREASTTVGCGLKVLGVVAGHFEQIICSTNEQLMTSRPANGIIFDVNPLLSSTRPTDNTLLSPCIEGMTGDGISLKACDMLLTLGGTSENHGGNGLTEFAGCQMNTYINFDCESNLGFADVFLAGQSSRMINCGTTKYLFIDNAARLTAIIGGWHDKLEVAAGAVAVTIDGVKVRFFGGAVGLVTNNNPFLTTKNVFDVQASAFVFYSKPTAVIPLTGTGMIYDNGNITDETILINPNGGTITQLVFRRAAGAISNINIGSGSVRLQPGDGLQFNYTGSPIFTRVPGGTNGQ